MNFAYSEDQEQLRQLARKILEDYCSNEQLREFDQGVRFHEGLWKELAAAGLLGIEIDEEYGGMAFDFESLCLLIEEVGRTVAPLPVIPALVLAAGAVHAFGSAELKAELLPGVASGEILLSAGLAQSNAYSLRNTPTLTARLEENDWVVDGQQSFVPFAEQASSILVVAQTSDGPALLMLPSPGSAHSGLQAQAQTATTGENQSLLTCTGLRVAKHYCLAHGLGAEQALQTLQNRALAATVAQMLGVCEVMLRMTASYTSEREQFGVKIATFQAVGQRAADCFIDVECLRLIAQRAVFAVQSCDPAEAEEACKIAKIWAADVGHRVSHAAQHLHGGMGVDRDYPLWRYCLWAKQLELQYGSGAPYTQQLGSDIAAQFKAQVRQ